MSGDMRLSALSDDLIPAIEPAITDTILKRFNRGACILHFVQGTMMLAASQTVEQIKTFKKPITTSFLSYNNVTKTLESETKETGISFSIGVMAAVFLLMSAVAHLIVLVKWDIYIRDIRREINQFRWYEYALSSSVMIMAIAVLFGCYDLGSLILIFVVNASMNFFGLLMEKMNPPNAAKVDWSPFIFGSIAGAAPWVVVFMYFLGGGNFDRIPSFVYGILVGYFVFFNTFPVNMALQYAQVGRWADYRYGELVYIVLSLLSKSLLGWLVFGGAFQPH